MLIAVLALFPFTCTAQNDGWRFEVAPYGLLAGMSGNVAVHGVPADVDVGFGDIWKNLQFGAMGRVSAHYGQWGLSTDLIYMGLGAVKNNVDVGVDQWMVQPSLEYQVNNWFGVLAGARYYNLNLDVRGPMGRTRSGTQEWWDPVVGGQVRLPLAQKVSVRIRGDIGGFGAGSSFAWQLEPMLHLRVKEWMSMQAGYRLVDVDYETGSGPDRFRYDILSQGPQFGMTFHF